MKELIDEVTAAILLSMVFSSGPCPSEKPTKMLCSQERTKPGCSLTTEKTATTAIFYISLDNEQPSLCSQENHHMRGRLVDAKHHCPLYEQILPFCNLLTNLPFKLVFS